MGRCHLVVQHHFLYSARSHEVCYSIYIERKGMAQLVRKQGTSFFLVSYSERTIWWTLIHTTTLLLSRNRLLLPPRKTTEKRNEKLNGPLLKGHYTDFNLPSRQTSSPKKVATENSRRSQSKLRDVPRLQGIRYNNTIHIHIHIGKPLVFWNVFLLWFQAPGAEHAQGSCRVGREVEGTRHRHDPATLHSVKSIGSSNEVMSLIHFAVPRKERDNVWERERDNKQTKKKILILTNLSNI